MDKPIREMNKDELEEFAKQKGVEIDKRRKLEDLVKVVEEAVAKPAEAQAPAVKKPKPTHVRNPNTGYVVHANPWLLENKEFEPCDADGNPV